MGENEFQGILQMVLEGGAEPEEINESVEAVMTYDEKGLLTGNTGLVVKLQDGSEFQLTIVKSR